MAERGAHYILTFPYSADEHAFVFSFETGDWWEENHMPINAIIQGNARAVAKTVDVADSTEVDV